MDKSEMIKLLPFCDKLTEKEKEYINNSIISLDYKKGSLVHKCGNVCLGMVYVLKGGLRVYLISEDGKEITIFRLKECDSCVLSASCVIGQITFETQMTAERDTELIVINAQTLANLALQNIYVKCFIYEKATEHFSAAMRTMQNMLFSKIERRIALFLVEETIKNGKSEIKMTHSAIATLINSAREVVARVLKKFEEAGFIEQKRGIISVKNIDRLRKI